MVKAEVPLLRCTVVVDEAELVVAGLLGSADEFDVIAFTVDGWNEGEPGWPSFQLALDEAIAAVEWGEGEWVRAEVRTTHVPDVGDWPVLAVVTRIPD